MLIKENKDQVWSENDSYTIERYRQFAKSIKPGFTVLDIGCNTGRGGLELKRLKANIHLHGVDLISERIDKIPNGIYDSKIACSVEYANYSENYFDVIVAGEIIEHIPTSILHEVFDACYKFLKSNGRLILTTPNPNSYLVKLGRKAVLKDPSHVNLLRCNELKEIAIKHGFKIHSVSGSGKATRYVGSSFPFFGVYGSYLMILEK